MLPEQSPKIRDSCTFSASSARPASKVLTVLFTAFFSSFLSSLSSKPMLIATIIAKATRISPRPTWDKPSSSVEVADVVTGAKDEFASASFSGSSSTTVTIFVSFISGHSAQ